MKKSDGTANARRAGVVGIMLSAIVLALFEPMEATPFSLMTAFFVAGSISSLLLPSDAGNAALRVSLISGMITGAATLLVCVQVLHIPVLIAIGGAAAQGAGAFCAVLVGRIFMLWVRGRRAEQG